MSTFGEHLRRQREMRGISLDEIVASTKISRRLLQALEDEQFDLLPGGIFNKSYVKAYAKCVGIDEDEAVSEYLQAAKETAPDARLIAQQHASLHSDRRPERSGFPLVPVLVLMVVAAGGVGGWKMYQDRLRERTNAQTSSSEPWNLPPQAAPASNANSAQSNSTVSETHPEVQTRSPGAVAVPGGSATGESTPAAAARAAQTAAGAPSQPADSSFEITVRPKDRAWVSIKADGNYVVRGIIQPPAVKTIHATSQVVFYTGNAGAVEVAFDGKDVPLAGGANDTETLVFDSHGLRPKAPAQ